MIDPDGLVLLDLVQDHGAIVFERIPTSPHRDGEVGFGTCGAQVGDHRNVVDRWAADPSRLALITLDAAGTEARYTYAEVADAAARLANLLAARGLGQGDRIVVMLPRIVEWQIAMVAAARMRAVPIPCITMLTASDLAYRVEHSGAVGVICPADECGKFDAIDSLSVRVAVGEAPPGWVSTSEAEQHESSFDPATLGAEDPAILYYTSGSTGPPKGVTHAARSLWAWSNSTIHWLGLDENERIWCTADTGWSKAGTSILFGPWSQGASVLFYDGPFVPSERFGLLERYEITCFCAAATELRRLILEDASGFDLSALRSTVSAGESVNPEIIDRWREITGTTVLDGYGQTETLMTVTNRPGREVKSGSMGRALPGVETAVRTADDTAESAGAGELLIRLPNPQLMLGYWDDADRTAASQLSLSGSDWFATGDNVEIDDDGYVFYTGRQVAPPERSEPADVVRAERAGRRGRSVPRRLERARVQRTLRTRRTRVARRLLRVRHHGAVARSWRERRRPSPAVGTRARWQA